MVSYVVSKAKGAKHSIFVWKRDLFTVARSILLSAKAEQRVIRRTVRTGLLLPPIPRSRRIKGSIWAIAMVRNEEDVLAETVRHLHRQGVSKFLIADNGSNDGTPVILEELRQELGVLVATDTIVAYHQSQKMTALAHAAARGGADWILPFDADERWFSLNGSIRDRLSEAKTPIVSARIWNAFPVDSSGEEGWNIDSEAARLRKVAFRYSPGATLHHGNHGVSRAGNEVQELEILHLPWRSFEQFNAKIRHGSKALDAAFGASKGSGGDHWRDLGALSEPELYAVWCDMLRGRTIELLEWTPRGELSPVRINDVFEWKLKVNDSIKERKG